MFTTTWVIISPLQGCSYYLKHSCSAKYLLWRISKYFPKCSGKHITTANRFFTGKFFSYIQNLKQKKKKSWCLIYIRNKNYRCVCKTRTNWHFSSKTQGGFCFHMLIKHGHFSPCPVGPTRQLLRWWKLPPKYAKKKNKQNKPCYSTDVEAETPILWPPDAKSWLIWKDPDAGKDWRREEKGTTEDEMVGWHHQLNGHEWTPGVGDGQGGLACCSPWGCKESDTTERLKWTELIRSGVRMEKCMCVFVCAGVGGGDGGTSYPKNILQKL